MPRIKNPRSGSMQFWPRVRASRHYARIKAWPTAKEAQPLGFAGYKVGMTHVTFIDPRKTSPSKGEKVAFPVTIVECPPIRICGIRCYTEDIMGSRVAAEVLAKGDKDLSRKIRLPKKEKEPKINADDFSDIRLLVHTQPRMTNIGKKKPEVFEMHMGGSNAEKLAYAKEHFGKEIAIKDVFKDGQQVDIHAVTKGKGFQGAIKRFGIHRKPSKSEKGTRAPGTLGGWVAQGHFMYRVPHAGDMGFHQRTEFNKLILKVGDKPEEVNPEGGFLHYGNVKNNFLIIKGGVAGPANRIVRFTLATRPNRKYDGFVPELKNIDLRSKQGR